MADALSPYLPTLLWLVPLLPLLGLIATGIIWAQSGVFARPILGFATVNAHLALTFDDGPHPIETPAILQLLAAGGHRATFFVIGDRAAAHPELIDLLVANGHTVANHSLHHAPWTPVLPARRLLAELLAANSVLAQCSGRTPRWLRAPVGLISPPVAWAARRANLQLVHWTATARDGVPGADPRRCLARLLPYVHSGAILVLHDGVVGRNESVARQVLPTLLAEMAKRGLTSIGLDSVARQ